MKYIALLRGINVGGNTIIKMSELKASFEACGYTDVKTYINSGNVLFQTEEKNTERIIQTIEGMLSHTFHYTVRIVVSTHEQIKGILTNVPEEWKRGNDLRCYIAFVRQPITPQEVAKEMAPKEGVDSLKIGKHVVYMSTKLNGLTKSGFTKIASKKVYQDITIRNYNTVQKINTLMEQ
jgi:uncharacterized protein (DUF1697 family)